MKLAGNQLSTLPKSIGNLRYLEYLDVSENKFADWPASVTKLKSLCKLNIANNEISYTLEYRGGLQCMRPKFKAFTGW